ncbi:uncharacterized protein [Zea mays]|jgi:hypothetical protein|uniref:uncharacterized protein n=1 Tax=Zea mays TaxID=4577 RepID=UPI0004DE80D8|nr:uncharacterized protein LOC103640564 [Zea mays]|eukprot:XP_008661840.1 uncharacterized protein LOC103640564 [Zea mays]
MVWRTALSGAPGVVHSKLLSFGFPRHSSALIHRTVWCTSGAMAICAQWSTLMDEQCTTVTRQKSEQKVRGAPDCPVWHRTIRCGTGLSGVGPDCLLPHEDKASNGRPAPDPNDRVTWRRTRHYPMAHRTVRCAHRQQPSPTATIWLVAINTTPTGHFKVWEPKQHSKSYS